MNAVSRIITGIIMTLGGLALVVVAIFSGVKDGGFALLFYGIPMFIFGIVILFNKKEDEIEQIKKMKVKGGKK